MFRKRSGSSYFPKRDICVEYWWRPKRSLCMLVTALTKCPSLHRSQTFFLRLALHKNTDYRDPYTERWSAPKRYVSSTGVSSQTSFGIRTLDGNIVNRQALNKIFLCNVFFWVIPRRLGSNSRRFWTLYRFHLHGQVKEEWLGMRRAVYLYPKGLWWESGGANERESDQTGWVESQQVVEGRGIYKCECGWYHCRVLSGCLLFLSLDRGFRNVGF